jgi:hypothetical protein
MFADVVAEHRGSGAHRGNQTSGTEVFGTRTMFRSEEEQLDALSLPGERWRNPLVLLSPPDLGDLGMKPVDLKSLAKPPQFTGKDEDFVEWRFKMESLNGLLQLEEAMEAAAQTESMSEAVADRWKPSSKLVYNLLATVCSGRALTIVKLVPQRNGFVAWRRLCMEFEPANSPRHLALLVTIMTPTFDDKTLFSEQVGEWERIVARYVASASTTLQESVRAAIINRWAPQAIRDQLRLMAPVPGQDPAQNYTHLKQAVLAYEARMRVYGASFAARQASVQRSCRSDGC